MSGSAVRAGLAFVEVALKSKVKEGVRQIQAQLNAVSASFQKFGSGLAAAGGTALAAFGAVGAALITAGNGFASSGAALDDMAQRTGIAGSSLSALAYVANQSGTDMSALEGGLRKMQKALVDAGDGAKGPSDALAKLGLSADKLLKLTPEEQFTTISEAIAKINDPTRRAAAAMEIFGKSGTQLLPIMRSDVRGLISEAKRLGVVLSDDDVSAAAVLDDSFARAYSSIKGLFNSIGAAIAEPLTAALDAFSNVTGAVSRFITENRTLVQALGAVAGVGATIGATLLAVGGAIAGVGASIGAMNTVVPLVTAGFATLSGAVTATLSALAPFAGIAAIVVGIGGTLTYAASRSGLLTTAFNEVIGVVGSLGGAATQTFGGIVSALGNGEIGKAAQVLWAGVKVVFFTGAKAAYDAFTWLFNNAWSIMKSLASAIVETLGSIFSQIPRIIKAAITGGESIADIIAATLEGRLGPLLKDQMDKAQAELNVLTGKDAKQSGAQTTQVQNTTQISNSSSTNQTTNISNAPVRVNNNQTLTSEATGNQPTKEQIESNRKAFDERIKSLREEMAEMWLGADAADLLKLRQQGLNDEQIKAIATLQQQRIALSAQKKAQEEAAKAREDAAKKADDEHKSLIERGKQMAEEVRTPFQVMQDRINEINRLQAGGFIDQATASAQRDKATSEFNSPMRDALKSGRNNVAEFNSQAAMDIIIRNQRTFSMGPNNNPKKNPLEDYAREQRDYLRIIADNAGKSGSGITIKTRKL